VVSVAGTKLINQIGVEIPPNTAISELLKPAGGGRDQSPKDVTILRGMVAGGFKANVRCI